MFRLFKGTFSISAIACNRVPVVNLGVATDADIARQISTGLVDLVIFLTLRLFSFSMLLSNVSCWY